MRGFALLVWCLVPIGAVAWHYGPGQDFLNLDDAGRALRQAEALVSEGDWEGAVDAYETSMAAIPGDRTGDLQRIRLERAKAMMMARQLPEAHKELVVLHDDLQNGGDAKILSETRTALANAQYYTTWLMRLEGQPEKEWEPEIESSRQLFKMLAEEAERSGNAPAAKTHRDNLESSIRLARMDLSELQALPLPSQCQGCCNGSCNGRGKGKGNGRGRGQQQPSEKTNRGAGGEMPPDTRGS